MGYSSLLGMLGSTDIETALVWHLSSNHYPPMPLVMVEPCLTAIANANAGDWDALINLPDGVLWRGENACPTYALIKGAHLDAFLNACDEGR
jgi:hypothetical protein